MVICMFNNYKIENNVLYLYVDDKCEIGSFFSDDKYSLVDKVRDYIKKMKIKFDGTKVVLILSGLLLGTVYLNQNIENKAYDVYKGDKYVYSSLFKNNIKYEALDEKVSSLVDEIVNNAVINTNKEEIISQDVPNKINSSTNVAISNNKNVSNNITKQENVLDDSNIITSLNEENKVNAQVKENTHIQNEKIVSVKRTNGEIINISLEEYLIGVVGIEMPASFNIEALKAQAIASRTYTMKLIEQNRTITDNISTQVYKTNSELQSMWGANYDMYYNKVKSAVEATKGLYMTYNGKIIDAVYHSTSNGYTQDAINVWGNNIPYLKTVTSPWDSSASSFLRTVTYSVSELSNKLGFDFNYHTIIEILSKDESNRISKIKIGDNEYTGVELRNILGLRSADFDIEKTDNGIIFTTRGYGHGVGMSQYGANGMANSGYNYDAILKHYYTGISIVK